MRVLLATGFKELDRSVFSELSRQTIESAGECYYREGLLSLAKDRGADVVVLSPHLPGQMEMVELVRELRMAGLRVILLPGRRDDPRAVDLAREAVALGAHDIVWDPVSPEAVINRVLNPATLAESGVEPEGDVLEMAVEKPKKKVPFWRKLFRKPAGGKTPVDSPAGTVNGGKPGVTSLETASGEVRKGQVRSRDSNGDNGMGTVFGGLPDNWNAHSAESIPGGRETVPVQQDAGRPELPIVLLIGDRAKKLVSGVIARGWKVADNSSVPPDVAVVDAELLPSVLGDLHCPVIAFSSGRLSEWFSLADSGIPVACGSDACLALAAGFLGSGHHREVNPVGSEGESSPALPAVSTPSRRRGFVIAFYSGAQGYQGKTVLAVNTAVLLAERGLSVCLADLDTDKAGLTALCGFSEDNPPPVDLIGCVSGALPAEGPAGVKLVPAPIRNPGWFPDPRQAGMLVARLAAEHDAVVLDFGARIASPAVVAALKSCDRVFLVSTPMRSALTAVTRFRGRGLVDVGGEKVTAVINRVGVRGGISPRDAARLLGVDGQFFEVPEDPAVVRAENEALEGGMYSPPVLKKKSLIRPALLALLDGTCRKKEVELC